MRYVILRRSRRISLERRTNEAYVTLWGDSSAYGLRMTF